MHAVRRREDGRRAMTEPLDLATGPVLCRAANALVAHGLAKDDFATGDARDAAGAIAEACGLDPTDWDADQPAADITPDERELWTTARAAALAALRALVGHLRPDLKPEAMSRRELVELAGDWNDHPDRTPAQVVTAMRTAAREMEPTP